MAVLTADIARILIERVEDFHPAPALFGANEVSHWPDGVLAQLLRSGLISKAPRASAIWCPGCERHCHEQVTVRRASQGLRAYIDCSYGYGRIGVAIDALRQYTTSLKHLAMLVASSIGREQPKASTHVSSYAVGQVVGRNADRAVAVAIDDGQVIVQVGTKQAALAGLLVWSDSGLAVHREKLKRLADRKGPPQGAKATYQADRSVQQGQSGATQRRNLNFLRRAKVLHAQGMSWTRASEQIAAEPLEGGAQLETGTVRRIITAERKRERENSRSKRR